MRTSLAKKPTIEYVATLKDLQELFPRLPKPSEWPHNFIKIKVQMGMTSSEKCIEEYGHTSIYAQGTEFRELCDIEFTKMNENGKDVWIYEGKVKV